MNNEELVELMISWSGNDGPSVSTLHLSDLSFNKSDTASVLVLTLALLSWLKDISTGVESHHKRGMTTRYNPRRGRLGT
jgi:hypothetical protein